MWIRSQDRKLLINVDNVCVSKMGYKDYVEISQIGEQFNYRLGRYSSEEKALKVLDEIQTCIMTEHQFRIDELNCTRNYFGKEYKEIYQMPQDEDVEV